MNANHTSMENYRSPTTTTRNNCRNCMFLPQHCLSFCDALKADIKIHLPFPRSRSRTQNGKPVYMSSQVSGRRRTLADLLHLKVFSLSYVILLKVTYSTSIFGSFFTQWRRLTLFSVKNQTSKKAYLTLGLQPPASTGACLELSCLQDDFPFIQAYWQDKDSDDLA